MRSVRRPLLAALVVLAIAPASARADATTCPIRAGGIDVTRATLPQIRDALAAGTATSRQLVETYLARIAAVNLRGPALHAVIVTAPDALAQADRADADRAAGLPAGALRGVPVLIKDNLDTFDLPTTAGAKAMLGAPPPTDAFVTARLRAAGAVILGKTNMSEWATSVSPEAGLSWSDVGGRAVNPYDGGDTSGSSNGSAIASSSSLAAATIGSETQGSIILPSFLNSATGLKPTKGLVSGGGVVPLIPAFDTPGPIARDVASVAALLGAITGEDPRDPVTARQRGHARTDYLSGLNRDALRGARIGVPRDLSKERMTRLVGRSKIVAVLRRLGATVVPLHERLFAGVPPVAILASFKTSVNAYLQARGPTSPQHSLADVIAFNRAGGKTAARYGQDFLLDAQATTARYARRAPALVAAYVRKARATMDRALRRHRVDALLVNEFVSSVTNTSGGNPAVTVQAGYAGKTPYGAIFTGPRWSEARLLGYAYAYEQATHAYRSPATRSAGYAAVCTA